MESTSFVRLTFLIPSNKQERLRSHRRLEGVARDFHQDTAVTDALLPRQEDSFQW